MHLTKKASRNLQRILEHARRAQAFLADPSIEVCRKSTPTTTLHFVRGDEGMCPIDKNVGSNLTGLEDAIKGLEDFLNTP